MLGCCAAVLQQMRCKEREMSNVIIYEPFDLLYVGDLGVRSCPAIGWGQYAG